MDDMGQIYEDDFTYREEKPNGKRKEGILQSECNKYRLQTEK